MLVAIDLIRIMVDKLREDYKERELTMLLGLSYIVGCLIGLAILVLVSILSNYSPMMGIMEVFLFGFCVSIITFPHILDDMELMPNSLLEPLLVSGIIGTFAGITAFGFEIGWFICRLCTKLYRGLEMSLRREESNKEKLSNLSDK